MIIDGKLLAQKIYTNLQTRTEKPRLGIVVVGTDPVIDSFVRIKKKNAERLGVVVIEKRLPNTVSVDDVIQAVGECVSQSDGVIVQLPLPHHIDTEQVLASIPLSHDVDGISTAQGEHRVHAPVAEAIRYILEHAQVMIKEKNIIVVGNGRLVGAPTALLLTQLGGHVSIVTRESGDIGALAMADIIVLGAGDSHFLKPGMIKEGSCILDAGTSESAGKVVGDADPQCAEKCLLFTPVPGGIGPVAVAMIFENLYTLVQR